MGFTLHCSNHSEHHLPSRCHHNDRGLQRLELDDQDEQDVCGIDRDNEEETEHAEGSPRGLWQANMIRTTQKRTKGDAEFQKYQVQPCI